MNLDKLDQAIAYIEAHPEEWQQEFWAEKTACGTALCLAGTLAALDGWKPTRWWAVKADSGEIQRTYSAIKNRKVRDIEDVAHDILGLERSPAAEPFSDDERMAHRLFRSSNTLGDIKRYRDRIAAGELL